MDNIFLAGLKAQHRTALATNGVPLYDLTIGKESGVMIEPAQLPQVLTLLAAQVVSRNPSTYEGIERITLAMIPRLPVEGSPYQIWADRENDLTGPPVQILAQVLLPKVARDLHVHCGPQLNPAPEDGKFHVHFWAVSGEDRSSYGRKIPSALWGLPINATHRFVAPTTVGGAAIISSAGGYVVAEMVGANNLMVYLDLARGSDWQCTILRELLRRTTLMMLTPEEWQVRARLLFAEECSRALAGALAHTTASAAEHKTRARSLAKLLASELRLGTVCERKMLAGLSLYEEAIGAEYESLLKIPKVKDVRVEGSNIIVMTETLNCRDDRTGNWHEIGAFRIALPIRDGKSPNWKNLTRTVSGYKSGQNAPHIWADGTACLGNTQQLFPDLLEKGQFAIAAQLAIEFVETANTSDSAGKHINQWPVARGIKTASPTQPAAQLDSVHAAYRQQYIAACVVREDEENKALMKEMIQRRVLVEQLQSNLVLELRAAMLAERQAKGLPVCNRSELLAEFDALLAVPKVRSVKVESGVIAITTDMLQCPAPESGLVHDIGQFVIQINVAGQADSVRWYNLTSARDAGRKSQQGPLVLASGRALFSDAKENFPDLIAQMQFSTVAMLAIMFIEQLAGDDCNADFINQWPVSGP